MLKAIYKCGSQCILPDSNDKDYLKVYETKEERREELIKNTNHSVDYHFDNLDRIPRVFLGCYIYPLMELVEGEEIKELKEFSIFDEKVKEQYVPLLKKYMTFLPDNSKLWYHILIACYMYERNKMSLTKTQLKKVQAVHDNGITKELKEYCLNQLDLIQ